MLSAILAALFALNLLVGCRGQVAPDATPVSEKPADPNATLPPIVIGDNKIPRKVATPPPLPK